MSTRRRSRGPAAGSPSASAPEASRSGRNAHGTGGAHPGEVLPPPLAVHRAGEAALLAEYPSTTAVLAARAAVQALAPAALIDLVPAERTLLLAGTSSQDPADFEALLRDLPAAPGQEVRGAEIEIGIVYDGEDLDEVAQLLGLSRDALISAHSSAQWTAAFGGFAPGFAYLTAEEPGTGSTVRDGAEQDSAEQDGAERHGPGGAAPGPVGPPWEVPRRREPRTAVPAGAVGLASRYCGIYPRPSPGGWQLIGRSDAPLFDVHREPPALLTPGTRVRFTPQRASARPSAATASALARAAREAAAIPGLRGRRRSSRPSLAGTRPVLEVLSPGPLSLLEDAGRPGRAAIGVSSSGAFDRGAMRRANLAVGNPSGAPVLETLVGPLMLRAAAPTVLAVSGARAPVRVGRGDDEVADVALPADASRERALALDPGDRIEVGPAEDGLRLVLAVRGGIMQIERGAPPDPGTRDDDPEDPRDAPTGRDGCEVLGSRSRDTLSGLGPAPLRAGDVLCAGTAQGLDAVPVAAVWQTVPPETAATGGTAEAPVEGTAEGPADGTFGGPAVSTPGGPADGTVESTALVDAAPSAGDAGPAGPVLEIPVFLGPRAEQLDAAAVAALLGTDWIVRQDSDRVGVRLEGPALPVAEGAASVPSEPMLPGAVQVPPSGLPVVFGPDHPATGGYPVIAVVSRAGLDALAQAGAGSVLRMVPRSTVRESHGEDSHPEGRTCGPRPTMTR